MSATQHLKPAEVRFLDSGKIQINAVGVWATITDKPYGAACEAALQSIKFHKLEISSEARERLEEEVRLWKVGEEA